MYEVRCIVGDKKLHEILRLLKGHTLEHPVVIPVDDEASVAATNGAVAPPKQKRKAKKPVAPGGRHRKGKGAIEILRALIQNSGADRISAKEMKHAVVAAGYGRGSYFYPAQQLTKEGVLKALPTLGDYEVIRG